MRCSLAAHSIAQSPFCANNKNQQVRNNCSSKPWFDCCIEILLDLVPQRLKLLQRLLALQLRFALLSRVRRSGFATRGFRFALDFCISLSHGSRRRSSSRWLISEEQVEQRAIERLQLSQRRSEAAALSVTSQIARQEAMQNRKLFLQSRVSSD